MLFNYRILLLILLILLPLTRVEAAQPMIETKDVAEQQIGKKQEKPTLRKKIYMWAGIATGIAAGIATAALIYFKATKKPLSPEDQALITKIKGPGLFDTMYAIRDLEKLEALRNRVKNLGNYWTRENEWQYIQQKDVLEKQRNEKLKISTKEEFLDALRKTTTTPGLNGLRVVSPDNREIWADSEVEDEYFARRVLGEVNWSRYSTYKDPKKWKQPYTPAVQQMKNIIAQDLKNVYMVSKPQDVDRLYSKLKTVDDQEFQTILESQDVKNMFEKKKADFATQH